MADTSLSFASRARKPSRASGSSSTISVVNCIGFHDLGNSAKGEFHGNDRPLVIAIPDLQGRVLTIKLPQSCARVCQSDALIFPRGSGRKPGSIVLYANLYSAVDGRRADENPARGRAAPDAMANGIFHQRL